MGRQCDDRTDDRLSDRVDTDGRHQKGDDRIAQDGFIWRLEEDPDAAQHTDRVDRRTGQAGNQRRCIFVSVKQLFIDPAAAIASAMRGTKAISRLVQFPCTPPMEKKGVKQKLVIVG